jgi:hypothetical protein
VAHSLHSRRWARKADFSFRASRPSSCREIASSASPHVSDVSSCSRSASASHVVVSSERTGPTAKADGRNAVATSKHQGKKGDVVKYHGDASVAARHNHLKPKRSHPVQAAHVSRGRSATSPGHVKPRAKPSPVPPGPYDAGPPPKNRGGGAGGGGHGKGK